MAEERTHGSVSELYAKHASTEECQDFVKLLNSRKLAKTLFALRCKAGLTQKELAAKTGLTQSKVSKIEHSQDITLTIGDILQFCEGLNVQLHLGLMPEGLPLVNKVKFHWVELQKHLVTIREISKGDSAMENAARDFTYEAAHNITNGLLECLGKVMPIQEKEELFTVSAPSGSKEDPEECSPAVLSGQFCHQEE
ncbi:helix-turn-helix transcriptional regulator [Chlorobium sp. BLA1]|uniref:helix-turn-helix domain-containing protein n=1 Tax=Candidatus Chlorobium masyuteum TaxID=2716876 RepID=UPI00141EC5AC|nr:helix-turn-helix transcriptional regulator [Candidatus Chlorobium masyuteum]NHQ59518.1 helix-turn-helix transcriptional regulator [Candidatus Chlorobium masyuteum]NTU45184.1 helix-turn-helix transcriptional regulator [Chlorobiaceae bacterium]